MAEPINVAKLWDRSLLIWATEMDEGPTPAEAHTTLRLRWPPSSPYLSRPPGN